MPHTDVVADSDRTRNVQKECERGYYCLEGVRYKCPKGRYGDKIRETNSSCTGECQPGYYCEEVSATSVAIRVIISYLHKLVSTG